MNESSDQILVQQAQAGDGTAYETLIIRHYRRVYGVCLGIVADPHEAQDLSQETMLQGFVKIGRLRQAEHFQRWLIEIAQNLCFDWLRKRNLTPKDQVVVVVRSVVDGETLYLSSREDSETQEKKQAGDISVPTSVMTLRADKQDIDAFATDKIGLDEFTKKVSVVIY